MKTIHFRSLNALALYAFASLVHAQEPKKNTGEREAANVMAKTADLDELALKQFGLLSDDASLLGYLKDCSQSDDDLLNIPRLIEQLGSPRQTKRNEAAQRLVAVGPLALFPLLKATEHTDAEVAERATHALKRIKDTARMNRVLPTIRLLRKRKVPGAFEMISRFLPYAVDVSAEEEIYYSLNELAFVDGKPHPALLTMISDKVPARRAVAGCILGRIGTADQKTNVRKLLADENALVRLRTAQGMLAGTDTSCVPSLIELFNESSPAVVWQAEELLHWFAGDDAPRPVSGACTPSERTACRQAWDGWWEQKGQKLTITDVFKRGRKPLLVISFGEERSILSGSNNRRRWERTGPPAGLFPTSGIVITSIRQEREDGRYDAAPKGTISAQTLTGVSLWTKLDGFIEIVPFQQGSVGGVMGSRIVLRDSGRTIQKLELDPSGRTHIWEELPANQKKPERASSTTGEFANILDARSFIQMRDGGILGLERPYSLGKRFKRLIECNADAIVLQELGVAENRMRFELFAPLIRFGFSRPVPRAIDDFPLRLADALAQNRSSDQRRCDLMVLGRQPSNPKTLQHASRCSDDEDCETRLLAMELIAKVEHLPKEIVPKIINALADSEIEVRRVASLTLVRCEKDSWEQVLKVALDEKSPRKLRLESASLLGMFRNTNNQALVAAIRQLLRQPDDELRASTLYGVYATANSSESNGAKFALLMLDEISKLVSESDNHRILAYAIDSVARLRKDGAKAIPYLMKVKNEKARGYAFAAIGSVGKGDTKALQFLIDQLKDTSLSRELRAGAVFGLRNLGPEARPALPILLKMLQDEVEKDDQHLANDGYADLWQALLGALEEIGFDHKDREAIPILQRILDLDSPSSRFIDRPGICRLIGKIDPKLGKREHDRISAEQKKLADERKKQK